MPTKFVSTHPTCLCIPTENTKYWVVKWAIELVDSKFLPKWTVVCALCELVIYSLPLPTFPFSLCLTNKFRLDDLTFLETNESERSFHDHPQLTKVGNEQIIPRFS